MKNRISRLLIFFSPFIFQMPVRGYAKHYVQYFSNGRIDFAELILPKNIVTINTIEQPLQESRKEESFSGLVVDCRGLAVKPAMVPVILDEDGNVIYGSAFIRREHAARSGIVSYVKDLASAQNIPRVIPRALTVKAIRAVKGRDSDVVISNDDGAKITTNPSSLSFLQKGRVSIVLD